MSPHELYALVGSLSLGTLTLLYALQWRDNHQPWAAWFAIAFLFHTLRYALHPLTQPAHGLTSTWAMVFLMPSRSTCHPLDCDHRRCRLAVMGCGAGAERDAGRYRLCRIRDRVGHHGRMGDQP